MAISPTILIVEDDFSIRNMYKFKLKLARFKVIIANDGEEGLSLAKKIRPDLVLLDLKMPKLNGEDMLEKMRATSWGSKIRVIVLTNISRDEAPMKLRLLAVDRYVVKAHNTPTQVLQIVREVLAKNTVTH